MTANDLPMMAHWLTVPRVSQWFDDPDYMDDLEDHLSDPRIRQWIVGLDGQPVAYLQDYAVNGWEDHPLGFLPQGARGLDTFIAEEALMGQGFGVRYLKRHTARLFEEQVPALGIDPHPENRAAIRCYEKVGFVGTGEVLKTPWGKVCPMALFPAI